MNGFNPRPTSFLGVLAWAATEARLKGIPFCPLVGERVDGHAVEWLSESFDAMSPTHRYTVDVTDLATGKVTSFAKVWRKSRTYKATGRTTVSYSTPLGSFRTFDEVNAALVAEAQRRVAEALAAARAAEVEGEGVQAEAYPVLGIDVLAVLSLGRTQQLEQRQMQLAAAPARPNLHQRINARSMPRERVEAAARQVGWLEQQKQAAYKKALTTGRVIAQRNLESWGCYEEDLGAGPTWRRERDSGAHEMAEEVVEAGCWDGRIEHQQAVLRNALQEWGVQEGCPHWHLLEIQLRFHEGSYASRRATKGFFSDGVTPYFGAASLRSVATYSRAEVLRSRALPWSDGPHQQPEQQQAQAAAVAGAGFEPECRQCAALLDAKGQCPICPRPTPWEPCETGVRHHQTIPESREVAYTEHRKADRAATQARAEGADPARQRRLDEASQDAWTAYRRWRDADNFAARAGAHDHLRWADL